MRHSLEVKNSKVFVQERSPLVLSTFKTTSREVFVLGKTKMYVFFFPSQHNEKALILPLAW